MSDQAPSRPRLRFSWSAILGVVLAAVGLVIFGFLGVPAIALGIAALGQVRTGRARGTVLAIIAILVGTVDVVFWIGNIVTHR